MMKIRNKILTVIIFTALIAAINPVAGQTTLNDLISYALDHSRDIKKAELESEEMKYQRLEAMGKGLPQAEATASYSKMNIPEIEMSPEMIMMIPEETRPLLAQLENIESLYMAGAGIQITQLIYNQAYWTGLKTTRKAQELYDLLKRKTEEEIIEEVANNYYQALSLIYQMNTINKSLVNLNEIYRIVKLNYESDFVRENEVNRLKVTITNMQVAQRTLGNAIVIQNNYIKALAGMPLDTVLVMDNTLPEDIHTVADQVFDPGDVVDYQVLLKQSELSNQQVKLAKAEYSPTLAAYGKLNYNSYATEMEINELNNMNTFGIQLKVPLFTSGVTHSKIKQAQLKELQLKETILKTEDLLSINYSNALLEYQNAYELLEVQRENRELAQRVYDQTSMQYKEGMASMADLLNVNSDFLQAENSYHQQILKCKLAEIKMMKSTGSIKQLVISK